MEREERLERKREWNVKNKEKISKVNRARREAFPDEIKKWKNEHREEVAIKVREWQKQHPESTRVSKMKCKTNRNLCFVAWTDWDNIKEFERVKPRGMTTDHYIPLKGDLVWGLHVSWNLRYLSKPENSCKHNNVDLSEVSNWYGKILEEVGLK